MKVKVKDLYLILAYSYIRGAAKIEVRTKGGEPVESEWNKLVEEYGDWFVHWYDPRMAMITIVKEEKELYGLLY